MSGLFLRHGLMIALLGIAIGLVGSLALTRIIAAQLFETSPTDPITLITVATMLALISLIACYVPARRATLVDPMEALRNE